MATNEKRSCILILNLNLVIDKIYLSLNSLHSSLWSSYLSYWYNDSNIYKCFKMIVSDSDYMFNFIRYVKSFCIPNGIFTDFKSKSCSKLINVKNNTIHLLKDLQYFPILSWMRFPTLKKIDSNTNLLESLDHTFLYGKEELGWMFRWLAVNFITNTVSIDFKVEEFFLYYLQRWYPFRHGFFMVKSTKSNQFFLFGLYFQSLRLPMFLNYAAIKTYYKSKSKNIYQLDYDYLYETVDIQSNAVYRIDGFHSAGSFGHVKKLKRSGKVVEDAVVLVIQYFIHYVTLFKIDFFDIYIKGSFRHVKNLYHQFISILRDNFFEYKSDLKSYFKGRRSFYKQLKKESVWIGMPSSDYLNHVKFCLSRSSYFYDEVLANRTIPNNHYLFYNIQTLESYLVEIQDVTSFVSPEYVLIYKQITDVNPPFSIYQKKLPLQIIKFLNKLSFKNHFQSFILKIKDAFKAKVNRTFVANTPVQTHSKNYSRSRNTAPQGSKPSSSNASKSSTRSNSQIMNNKDSKTNSPTIKDLLDFVSKNPATSKIDSKKPKEDLFPEKPKMTFIDLLKKRDMVESKTENTNSKTTCVFILNQNKLSSTKIMNVWNLMNWFQERNRCSIYRYYYTKGSVRPIDAIRLLFSVVGVTAKIVTLFSNISQLNFRLRIFFMTLPRSFSVIDLTSYAFNGCRRTRHYHKNRTY